MTRDSSEWICYLDYTDGENNRHRIEIRQDLFSIGRAYGNELRIDDTRISRRHAEIVREGELNYLFRDKDSKCGSFINGERVKEHQLKPGDEVTLGSPTSVKLLFGFAPKLSGTLESMDTTSNALISNMDTLLSFHLHGATIISDQQTRFLNTALMNQPEYVSSKTFQRLTSLYEISHKLLLVKSLEELARVWLEQLFLALPIDRGAILLYNQNEDRLETVISRDRERTNLPPINGENSIIEHTFEDNVAIHTNNAESIARFASTISPGIGSLLSAPISSNLRAWGVCYLDSAQPASLNLEDLEFLMATAREAGLVIENLKLQEQLIRTERLATIGKLTSSISHEIRNRLVLLVGAELIEQKYGHDPDVKQFTDMVLLGQRRALALVEEIRAFARNHKVQFEKQPQSLVQTIERALTLLRVDASVVRRKLSFDHTSEPIVKLNEEKIEQVIINLVRNAVEATRDDGEGEIRLSLTTDQDQAILAISDNGSGIPAEILARIWEPFFTTKGEEGTGLGLGICRRIIEAHGGRISCQSEPGKGTTFTIKLPIN